MQNKNLSDLEQKLGYSFNNKNLLIQALTHKSIRSFKKNKDQHDVDNERIEFLGDRVLGLSIADYLYKNFKEKEGSLALKLSYLAGEDLLFKVASSFSLKEFIIVDTNKDFSKRIIASALEAIFGAIYLDSNDFTLTQSIIINIWKDKINNVDKSAINYKGRLQEICVANNLPIPLYDIIKKEGLEHEPIFTISLSIEGFDTLKEKGLKKKAIEANLAKKFIEKYFNE